MDGSTDATRDRRGSARSGAATAPRVASSVTSITWIPSEAISGLPKLPFTGGALHYDEAPPDDLGPDVAATVQALATADRLRFANELSAWIEVQDGRVTGFGQDGGGVIGATRLRLGGATWFVPAVALPDLQPPPEVGDGWVRFTQTAGGRTGVPAPRTVRHPPFVQLRAPSAWTTLTLTLHADGRAEHALVGASPFPRHWVYDHTGALVAKTGVTRFGDWWTRAFGKHTPWGDLDSPALVTAVESALERQLSGRIMRSGAKPRVRSLVSGAALVEQGDAGDELFLLLDGVLRVEVDGVALTELGPGAVLGERAVLEGGRRTSTLRAVTPCRVAAARSEEIELDALEALAAGHRREAG